MDQRGSDSDRRARQGRRLGRTLRLLCLIQGRGRWNLRSLAAELECSTKTVQRDLLVLEAARVPFFYDERLCCYRVRPDFRLPFAETPAGQDGQATTADADTLPTPGELAGSSRDSAERLLAEAERLVGTLGQLCQSLRPPGPQGEAAGPGGGGRS